MWNEGLQLAAVVTFGFSQGFVLLPTVTLGGYIVRNISSEWRGSSLRGPILSTGICSLVLFFLLSLGHIYAALSIVEFLATGISSVVPGLDLTPRNLWLIGEASGVLTFVVLPRLESAIYGRR